MMELEGQLEVGLVAAKSIFGDRGGTLMGALISFGLLSTISSMTWAGPRVAATMGEDYNAFRWLARRNRFGVPAWGILLQTVLVLGLVISMKFEQLIYYIQSILILSSLMTVLAVVWLRVHRPLAARPYRVPMVWFPVALFATMNIYMLWFQASQKPWELGMGIATLAVGAGLYVMITRSDGSPTQKVR
jgi:APA family basic amino acid/polyamine antiporter